MSAPSSRLRERPVEVLPTRRSTCERCGRPTVTCYCAHLRPLATRTQVLLLQHPREERTAIGTAHMAHLALAGSVLRVGLELDADPVVAHVLAARPDRFVLFPGDDAIDVDELPRDRAITLVVVDGTWWQAKKLLALNPALAALPRVAFRPRAPSNYRIRKQPASYCLSTVEALAEVLGELEGDGDRARFRNLLAPFEAMVDTQLRYTETQRASRHARRALRPRAPAPARLAARLAEASSRLVCFHADANGWPARHPAWRPAELVHLVAQRPASGEALELVIRPRGPLTPDTPAHVELARERLEGGLSLDDARARWQAFLRPDDVALHFGPFSRNLVDDAGLALPGERVDLRSEARQLDRSLEGGLEATLERFGVRAPETASPGRATRRLAALLALYERLRTPTS